MHVPALSVALALGVLAAACQSVDPGESSATSEAAAKRSDVDPPAPPTIPPPDAPPPPPTRPPPPGTSDTPGAIRQILAVDDQRAIVVFTRQGTADTPPPILAAMRADGTIDWSVEIDGQPLVGRTSTGIELVGDAVSIAIGDPGERRARLDRIEFYGVTDGALRATVRAGPDSYARDTIVDRGLRIDTFVAGEPHPSQIVATDATGEVWRRTLPGSPDTEVIGLPQHVAVRLRISRFVFEWHVFDRRGGAPVAVIPGDETCSDAQRWFVQHGQQLHAVDLTTFTTRVVLDADQFPTPEPPSLALALVVDPWTLLDCTIVDGRPLAFATHDLKDALIGAEPGGGWSIQPLGTLGAIDPLPDRLHPVMALGGLDDSDAYDLITADLRKAEPTGSNAPETRLGAQALLSFDDEVMPGSVVATRDVLGMIDGSTGAMIGYHVRRDTMALHRTQRAGRHLWLPPAAGMRLGRAAPTVLDLRTPPGDARVRGALAVDLGADRRGRPAFVCDSMDSGRMDGLGTAAGLEPVTPSREPPWDAEHVAQAARGFACASPSSIVTPLAWAIVQDDRPLRNHYALMMVEEIVDGGAMYTVVSMYRHAVNRDWNISTSFHIPISHLRRYVRRPTTADLDEFIDHSRFAMVERFGRLLAGNVLDANWRRVTNEAPVRRFPATVEQID